MFKSRQSLVAGLCALLAGAFCVLQPGPMAEAAGLIAEDLDHDGDVDAGDFAILQSCLSGSGVVHDGSPACADADIDYDGDVDMTDFGAMQGCFSGEGLPGDPVCGGWCVRPKTDRPVSVTTNPVVSGQSADIVVSISQVGVSYQLRNDATGTNVGSPVDGTEAAIHLSSGPLTAAATFNVLATNSAAGCSVQLSDVATVTVVSPQNRIGLDVLGGPRNGYVTFLQTCADAGKPVALVSCVDDFSPAFEARMYSPQTFTVGRLTHTANHDLLGFDEYVGQDPAQFAQTIFNEVHPRWDVNPCIDAWAICYEWNAHYAWQADFYIAMMDLAESAGHRVALFSSAVGTPPETAYPDVARACARARAHGGHILALHEFAINTALLEDEHALSGDQFVLRYRRLYGYLIPRNADCPLAITEAGQGVGAAQLPPEVIVHDFGWYDTQLRQDGYTIGFGAWALGIDWGGVDLQPVLPALAQYIVTH
jgi:hypothetical protein